MVPGSNPGGPIVGGTPHPQFHYFLSTSDTIQQRQLKDQRNAPLPHRLSFPTYRHNTALFSHVKYSRHIYSASYLSSVLCPVLWLLKRAYKHWEPVNFCSQNALS
ncbi:uncharacterised protein [Saccharolobus solfataricus]|uniref:Uncharacterized protein n=1 Tax=Saccharolobus solfataricus TaxID=2287 RepID=A0A157T151_SACSO|nr:uncharacterised protein [Saccharolobus solfataricus]